MGIGVSLSRQMCSNWLPYLTINAMSCCAFPPPSNEPRYSIHPLVLEMLESWEQQIPGLGTELADEISLGHWDRIGEADDSDSGNVVPPFSALGSVDFAIENLEPIALRLNDMRLKREGPWYIRWGLKQPSKTLNEPAERMLEQMKSQALEVKQHIAIQAMTWEPSTLLPDDPHFQAQAQQGSCCR